MPGAWGAARVREMGLARWQEPGAVGSGGDGKGDGFS